jgi:hypothetical protein
VWRTAWYPGCYDDEQWYTWYQDVAILKEVGYISSYYVLLDMSEIGTSMVQDASLKQQDDAREKGARRPNGMHASNQQPPTGQSHQHSHDVLTTNANRCGA